jgi:hypothetical protein
VAGYTQAKAISFRLPFNGRLALIRLPPTTETRRREVVNFSLARASMPPFGSYDATPLSDQSPLDAAALQPQEGVPVGGGPSNAMRYTFFQRTEACTSFLGDCYSLRPLGRQEKILTVS